MITKKTILALIFIIILSPKSFTQDLINYNKNDSFYLQAINYALGEPHDFNWDRLKKEHKKYGNIIIILSDYNNTFPDTINEFNIIYLNESDLVNKKLVNKKLKLKETRFVLQISQLYIDINNNIVIETPGFYLTKDYEIRIKNPGFTALRNKRFVTFEFDCENNTWEILK